jgi:hypothetical protein
MRRAEKRRREPAVSSNDEVERRAAAPTHNEADLSQSSIHSLAHRRRYPRDRSNRLLDAVTEGLAARI